MRPVIDGIIDRIDAFAQRHRRLIAIVGGIWVVVSWASNAHLVAFPEIPFLTGTSGVIASSMFMALWWAWLSPRVTKRRAEREAGSAPKEEAHG